MPWSDVFSNVWLPLRLAGVSKEKARPRVEEALAQVGLSGFAKAYPRQLSGGMKMRVSIARALVTRPAVLLMDEPFAALDEITRLKLNDDLAALQSSLDATVVFVTHSVFESVYLADRIVVMAARPGRAVAEITVEAPADSARRVPPDRALCRNMSPHFRGAACGDGRDGAERARRMTRDDFVGYAVPALTLGLGLLGVGRGGALFRHPALSFARAERHHRHAVHRLADALGFPLGDAVDHTEGAARGGGRKRDARR